MAVATALARLNLHESTPHLRGCHYLSDSERELSARGADEYYQRRDGRLLEPQCHINKYSFTFPKLSGILDHLLTAKS